MGASQLVLRRWWRLIRSRRRGRVVKDNLSFAAAVGRSVVFARRVFGNAANARHGRNAIDGGNNGMCLGNGRSSGGAGFNHLLLMLPMLFVRLSFLNKSCNISQISMRVFAAVDTVVVVVLALRHERGDTLDQELDAAHGVILHGGGGIERIFASIESIPDGRQISPRLIQLRRHIVDGFLGGVLFPGQFVLLFGKAQYFFFQHLFEIQNAPAQDLGGLFERGLGHGHELRHGFGHGGGAHHVPNPTQTGTHRGVHNHANHARSRRQGADRRRRIRCGGRLNGNNVRDGRGGGGGRVRRCGKEPVQTRQGFSHLFRIQDVGSSGTQHRQLRCRAFQQPSQGASCRVGCHGGLMIMNQNWWIKGSNGFPNQRIPQQARFSLARMVRMFPSFPKQQERQFTGTNAKASFDLNGLQKLFFDRDWLERGPEMRFVLR
mmetsp:Transcript_12436/g.34516  ORF Transcript_12436/g.34516 Transcript_12436/m.34516 type:complete len:433 (+) Transcript_12436:408-1706(+)